MAEIMPLTREEIISARYSEMKDYEAALVDVSAYNYLIDYIVTRNIKDFVNSRVKAITPVDALQIL